MKIGPTRVVHSALEEGASPTSLESQIRQESRRDFHGTLPEGSEDWDIVRRFSVDLSDLRTDEARQRTLHALRKAQGEYAFAKYKFERHVEAVTQLQGQFMTKTVAGGGDGQDRRDTDEAKNEQEVVLTNSADGIKFIPDWYCFLESDVYFIPENFKRFALLRGYDPWRQALFLGHVWLYGNILMGQVTEHNYGSCLSRRAFVKLAVRLAILKREELEDERLVLERARDAVRRDIDDTIAIAAEKEMRKSHQAVQEQLGEEEDGGATTDNAAVAGGGGGGDASKNIKTEKSVDDEGKFTTDLWWIRQEQDRIWNRQSVRSEGIDGGISPAEVFSERFQKSAVLQKQNKSREGDHKGENDGEDRTGTEVNPGEKEEQTQNQNVDEEGEQDSSSTEDHVVVVDDENKSTAALQDKLQRLHHILFSLEHHRYPTLHDPEVYVGKVRPNSMNHFGTRRIPSHFQCLPWKPYEWHDSIGIVQACLFDIGVFSEPAQTVTDSLGRYFWAQALNRVVEYSPPVAAEDFTVLAPRDIQESYGMLKGMWVARLHTNRICLGKRREKQLARLLYLRKQFQFRSHLGGNGKTDTSIVSEDHTSPVLDIDGGMALTFLKTAEQSSEVYEAAVRSAEALLHDEHFMAYGDTGGLLVETAAAAVIANTAVVPGIISSGTTSSSRTGTVLEDGENTIDGAEVAVEEDASSSSSSTPSSSRPTTTPTPTPTSSADSTTTELPDGADEVLLRTLEASAYLHDASSLKNVDFTLARRHDWTADQAKGAEIQEERDRLESLDLELAEANLMPTCLASPSACRASRMKKKARMARQDASSNEQQQVQPPPLAAGELTNDAFRPETLATSLNAVLRAYVRDNAETYAYSEYPICFHGHRAAELNTREVVRNTGEKKKDVKRKKLKNFSMGFVHSVVRGGRDCPRQFCADYVPKVWKLPQKMKKPSQKLD
ncbi:unnamed protein product [Amoebophrya sp. A25]|nr:unnamed protein product [Amoebophrya sp. A25]|eukprot:GSA25T00019086001.1